MSKFESTLSAYYLIFDFNCNEKCYMNMRSVKYFKIFNLNPFTHIYASLAIRKLWNTFEK